MPKTVSAGHQAHLPLSDTTLAFCYQVARKDGVVLGGTEHDTEFDLDIGDGNGTVTYKPALGLQRTGLSVFNSFKPPDVTLGGFFDPAGITKADLRAGRYSGAIVKIFMVNYRALADGPIPWGAYIPGAIDIATGFEVALRGVVDRYSRDLVRKIRAPCHLELGELIQCRAQLAPGAWPAGTLVSARLENDARSAANPNTVLPSVFNDRQFECTVAGTTHTVEPTWNTTLGGLTVETTGVTWIARRALTMPVTIASVVSQREFTVNYTGDAPDADLANGRAKFTGASANTGLLQEIKTWTLSTNTVKCRFPFPFAIAVNDTLDLIHGCAKTTAACFNQFGNIFNHGGHPNVPSIWVLVQKQ